jgi:hypothetical protein
VSKECKSKTRYVSRLSELFISTNMLVQVLETVQRKEKRIWKRIGCEQPTSARAWHTGLSGGAPNSVRCDRLADGEPAALEKRQRCTAKNSPDYPVSQLRQRPTVIRAINARHVASSNGRLGAPDCPVCTEQCPVRQTAPRSNGRLHPMLELATRCKGIQRG